MVPRWLQMLPASRCLLVEKWGRGKGCFLKSLCLFILEGKLSLKNYTSNILVHFQLQGRMQRGYLPRRNGMAIRIWDNQVSLPRAGPHIKSGCCQEEKWRRALGWAVFKVCHVCLLCLLLRPWVRGRPRGGIRVATGRGRKRYSRKLTAHDDGWFRSDQNDKFSPVRQTKSSPLFCSLFTYSVSECVLSFKKPLQ